MDFQGQTTSEASIKAYLLDKNDKVAEIRRFALPCPARVACLVEKVCALYSIACPKQLRLQWLDPECDRVTFTTDEELQDALTATATEGTLRVYVSHHAPLVSARSSDVVHPDVVCDGCEHPVRGYRFKCVICPDFDLCCHCVVLDRHSEHPMILLRRPKDPFICRLSKLRAFWARRCRQEQDTSAGSKSLPSDCVRILRELEAAAMKVLHQQQQQQSQQSQQSQCGFSEASLEDLQQRCDSINPESLAGGVGDADCSQQEMLQFVHSMSNSLNALLQPLGIEVSYHTTAAAQAAASPPCAARQQSTVVQPPVCPQQQQQQQQCQLAGDTAMAVDEAAAAAAAAAADAAEAAAAASRPPLPEHVATALSHMQAMGFTDEGGRLTELLLSANGDIYRVLDALRQT